VQKTRAGKIFGAPGFQGDGNDLFHAHYTGIGFANCFSTASPIRRLPFHSGWDAEKIRGKAVTFARSGERLQIETRHLGVAGEHFHGVQ
jgi:hypothetical protein